MSKQKTTEPPLHPAYIIVYGEGTASSVDINQTQLVNTARELGISDDGANETTLYVDPKNRLLNNGTHYPNKIGKLRFWNNSSVQGAEGDIIRISTKVRGKQRTPEEMNGTLVHELEHLAQQERHDKNLTEGHIAIGGLIMAGAVLGNKLSQGKLTKVTATILGAGAGYFMGSLLASHERQARARQKTTRTYTFTSKSHT